MTTYVLIWVSVFKMFSILVQVGLQLESVQLNLVCCHEVSQHLPDPNAFQAAQSSSFDLCERQYNQEVHALLIHHNPPISFLPPDIFGDPVVGSFSWLQEPSVLAGPPHLSLTAEREATYEALEQQQQWPCSWQTCLNQLLFGRKATA